MLVFYGRMGKRLPDAAGFVRFKFVHVSGAVFELKLLPVKDLPKEYDRVVATGKLIHPGVIAAHEISHDADYFSATAH